MVVIVGTLVHDRERQAGVDAPTVHEDGAGTACAVVAALLGSGKAGPLSEHVQQRGAVVDADLTVFTVYPQMHD